MNLIGVDLNLLGALDTLLAERQREPGHGAGQPAPANHERGARSGGKLFDDRLLIRVGGGPVPTPLAKPWSGSSAGRSAPSIESVLTVPGRIRDQGTDHHALVFRASDYVGLVLLRPLPQHLVAAAPQVRLIVRPATPDVVSELRRGQVDETSVPPEMLPERTSLSRLRPVSGPLRLRGRSDKPDRWGLADRRGVRPTARISQWRNQPAGPRQRQLRALGALGAGPLAELSALSSLLTFFLLAGIGSSTLVLERLVANFWKPASVRLAEPPAALQRIAAAMYWSPYRADDSSRHRLRAPTQQTAAEL